MVLIWPGSLLGLVLVGAVAAWALFRPSRHLAVVGSLALWEEALAALGRSARRRSRRITTSWLLLLAGAVAAAVALARPVANTHRPARRVRIAVRPGAELGGSPDALREAVGGLLGRLDDADRVRLLRPLMLGGASAWLSVAEAKAEAAGLPVLPAGAEQLAVPEADPEEEGGRTYRFGPAGSAAPSGPGATAIDLPARLAEVTIDAVGASALGGGGAQLFALLRNQGTAAWSGRVRVSVLPSAADRTWADAADVPVTVEAGGRKAIVRDLPAAAAVRVQVGAEETAPGGTAYLARTAERKLRVALIGSDEPVIRRFIEADEALEWVAGPADADVVIANRSAAPSGKPALVIDPPVDPPGWRRGEAVPAVVLRDADIAADDPVLRGVDLASVAVRVLRPWVATTVGRQKVLVGRGGAAVVLASGPDGTDAGGAGRVYVAFELSTDNTNLSMSEAFVVFLANAVRWLAPGGQVRPGYEHLSPLQAPRRAGWTRLAGSPPKGAADTPLPWPGLFRDEAGDLRAVSLVGLRAARPQRPPAEAVAAAPLPSPAPVGRSYELWPALALAAAALWLAGWWLRLR